MSVVAYDGRVLAADRIGICGDVKTHNSPKIVRLHTGAVVAWTGTHIYGRIMADWYARGAVAEDWPSFQRTDEWVCLVVYDKGSCFFYETEPLVVPVESPYWAWGSGQEVALGVLYAGGGAEMAVQAACDHCLTCGGGVDSFLLEGWREGESPPR